MAKPNCFFGKNRHYTDLRLRVKRFNLFKALNSVYTSDKSPFPSDESMLLFLTYESDVRGKRIHQLENLVKKRNQKIKRLKKKLTIANKNIESSQEGEASC